MDAEVWHQPARCHCCRDAMHMCLLLLVLLLLLLLLGVVREIQGSHYDVRHAPRARKAVGS